MSNINFWTSFYFLLFLVCLGFTVFVNVITIQYVDDVSKTCDNKDSTKGEIIKIVAILDLALTGLMIFILLVMIFATAYYYYK